MTEMQTRILAALAQANALTAAEIARDIDADAQATQRALHALDDAGHVILRNGLYRLSVAAKLSIKDNLQYNKSGNKALERLNCPNQNRS